MAKLILSPVVQRIIGGLGSVAVQEIALLWGVNKELDQLEKTISLIRDVLLDAEEKQGHSRGVTSWLERLGDSVHEADDLIDEFNTEALRQQVMPGNEVAKQVCTFFSGSNQLAFRHKMGRRIREIKRKLDVARNDRSFLLLEARSPDDQQSRVVVRKRETHSFVPQDEVVGRDEDREAIVKILLEGEFEESVGVIPIVGIGGLGKTTLAQSVFNDEKVQQHFELKAWVCVSDNFDLKVTVQTITKSKEVELDQLQQDLRKMLGGKRYLFVLDDVWEENRENWLKLKSLLIGGAEGSRIVVTTRSKKVAAMTSITEAYQLGVLDEDKSWSLFEKMAFRQRQDEKNSNLVGIGREIVKRCGGIPLAIRTIGGMLYFKNSESEWCSLNKEFSKIPQSEGDILPTLRLSYNNLASHLKQCFAYCRLFPKDYIIGVQELVKFWMAQGFLKLSDSVHDQCLEDVGNAHFMELYERSFFQEVKIDEFGVGTCKMHDLIHDLAVEVAGTEYSTVSSSSQGNINRSTRHMSFEFHIDSMKQTLTSLLLENKIRTVLLLRSNHWVIKGKEKKQICDAIISNADVLRTLDLNGLGITTVPDSISRLNHVRYLDFTYNSHIKTLPNSITNLFNLQTLKLNFCYGLLQLPVDIKKLVNLRHLEILGCFRLRHMPEGLGRLSNLQTLSMFVLPKRRNSALRRSGELNELGALNNLKGKLEILNLRHGKDAAAESESANLKEKRYLLSLDLEWDSDVDQSNATNAKIVGYEMSLEGLHPHSNLQELSLSCYGGVKFSSWLPSLANLVSLTISSCPNVLTLFPMSQFHNLKKLELLNLSSLEYITSGNCESENMLLPSLQKLRLVNLPKMKGWWREHVVSGKENQHKLLPSFQCLSYLYIWNCSELTSMPLCPHLETLDLGNSSLKPFELTILESTPATTSSFLPLSKLKTLYIRQIEDLQCLPDWFRSLTSLEYLLFEDCSQLKDLFPGLKYLTSLQRIWIANCEELIDAMVDVDAIMWKALNGRLKDLTLSNFPKLEVPPEGIKRITSLQRLSFWSCNSLTTIPEWIVDLRSLRSLTFSYCKNLTLLPEGIRSLTSLESLEIHDCPILLKRCQREIGEDWPKIEHIRNLNLGSDHDKDKDSAQKKWNLFKTCGL